LKIAQRKVVLWKCLLAIPQHEGAAMLDIFAVLETIRRPRLLMQAARFGMGAYQRERDLRRLIGAETNPDQALKHLISEEGKVEDTRLAGAADYAPARHVELLAALIAEARRLPRLVG
jgi:Family of unknown function (DUF6477)